MDKFVERRAKSVPELPEDHESAARRAKGLLTPRELKNHVMDRKTVDYLVEDLLPARSLGILVGDSGLGKTALAYQLGLAIAHGKHFLGRKTAQGKVLILDYENSSYESNLLFQRISLHLRAELESENDNILLWSPTHPNSGAWEIPEFGFDLTAIVKQFRPKLVIVDSLRSHNPYVDEKPSVAAELLKEFRQLNSLGCSALFLHHVKKPGEAPLRLDDAPLMNWLLQASGPRAWINQTDVRLAVEGARIAAGSKLSGSDEIALLMRVHVRVRGEVARLYLSRHHDDEGEPIGYDKVTGLRLLFNAEQEACYEKLGERFSFKDAKLAYGRHDQPTADFLAKCMRIGVLRKAARGIYEKVTEQAE
jgi:hypothetical protein